MEREREGGEDKGEGEERWKGREREGESKR